MSFRRRRRRPLKRTFRRGRRTLRGIRGNRNTRLSIRKRVAKMERQIEKKTHDQTFNEVTLAAQEQIFYLNTLTVGTGDNQRIGKRANLVSFQFKFNIKANGAMTLATQIRLLLIRDKQNKAALPEFSDILDSTSMHSLRNKANFSRFDIMRDQVLTIQPLTEQGSIKTFTWFIKPKGRRAQLEWLTSVASGDSVSEGGMGAYYLVMVWENSDVATSASIFVHIRMRFTDA